MFLTPEEIEDMTGKERPSAQARELDRMEPPVPYRKRSNGSLVVLRIHVETFEGCRHVSDARLPADPQLVLEH